MNTAVTTWRDDTCVFLHYTHIDGDSSMMCEMFFSSLRHTITYHNIKHSTKKFRQGKAKQKQNKKCKLREIHTTHKTACRRAISGSGGGNHDGRGGIRRVLRAPASKGLPGRAGAGGAPKEGAEKKTWRKKTDRWAQQALPESAPIAKVGD